MNSPDSTAAPDPTTHKTFWAWTVATFFGAGLGKPGPGTWGSVAAVLLWAAYAWGLHPSAQNLLITLLVGKKDEDFPFCSDRCRKIDLGKWAMGVYKISSPVLDPEVLEDLGAFGGGEDKDKYRG